MQGTQLWSPIFAHVRSKCCNVASLFVGSSSEDESVFGLRLWQVQKVVCSSLCLHIRKPKNLSRTESGEDFLAYGCANTGLNQFPFAFAKTSIQAHSQLQTCYPPNKDATDLFFSFMAVQTQAWTNSLLHVPQPQSKDTFIFTATHKQRMCLHASRSRIAAFCWWKYKGAQTLCFAQCTYSARTVHGTVHATVHGHKTL